jgi:hypothetical protein
MKNSIDVIAQRIFASFVGLALFTFALGTIVNNSAKADNPTTVNNSGKYQISTAGFEFNGKPIYNIVVWDSETGKSKIYGFSSGTGKMAAESFQLPSSPLY